MTVHLRDRYGDWTPKGKIAQRMANPKRGVPSRWVLQGRHLYVRSAGSLSEYPSRGFRSPRGDLKRELVEQIRQEGKPQTGRQRRNLRKALARGGYV